MDQVEANLMKLGLTLPAPPAPVAAYVPTVRSGLLLYVSGQISLDADGKLLTGKAGQDLPLEQAQEAARLCALNLLAQAKAASGSLENIARVVRLAGFVNAAADFTDHPKVINAASDLMLAVFGEAGRHARAAVGVSSLPLGAAVEIEAIFELRQ